MKSRTLIADRLYYGLEPVRLRAATSRALARVVGLAPERARISATNLPPRFRRGHAKGEALVGQLVADGLLSRLTSAVAATG